MNNKLIINRIEPVADAASVPGAFAAAEVPYHTLDALNWPDSYPYKPDVRFAAAHTSDAVLLHFKVSEQAVLARCSADRESVWQDSCVEFFLSPDPSDGLYYNFEWNCIGRLYCCVGPDRNSRQFLPESAYAAIKRASSLGETAFEERLGECEWDLSAIVPVSCLVRHDIASLDGLQMSGNFYKCGDHLSVPHFVSYAPINVPKPDFHRPDCFCKLVFE